MYLKTRLLLYITFLCCCYQSRCKLLLPYGTYIGDSKYEQNFDAVNKVAFKKPTILWNEYKDHLWVTTKGGIFDDNILKHTSYKLLTSSWRELPISAILPYYMDLNFPSTDKSSALFIRNFAFRSHAETINEFINKQDKDFILNTDQILVATWHNAKSKTNHDDIRYQNWGNTFQAVIASNGTKTYTIFSYEKLEHNPSNFSINEENLKIGIKLSESNYCSLPANQITKNYNAQQLICRSNVNQPGMLLYDVTDSTMSKCNETAQSMEATQHVPDVKVDGDFNNITVRPNSKQSDEVYLTFYAKNTTAVRHMKFYIVRRGLNPADTERFYLHGDSFEDLTICNHPYYTAKIWLTKPGFYAIRISLGLITTDSVKYTPWSSFGYVALGMTTEPPKVANKPVEAPQSLSVSLTPVPDRLIISWKYNGSQENIYSFEIQYENKNATYIVGPQLEYQNNNKTHPFYSVGITIYEYGNFVFNVRAINKQQKPGPWSTTEKIIDRKSLEAINTTYSDFVPKDVAVQSVERPTPFSANFILTWYFPDPYHRVMFFEIIFTPPYNSRPIQLHRSKLLSDTLHTYTLKYPYSLRLPGSQFYSLPYKVKVRAAYKTYEVPMSKAFAYGPWSNTTEYYYVPPTKTTTSKTTTNEATTEQQIFTSSTTPVEITERTTTSTTKIKKQSTTPLTSTKQVKTDVNYIKTDHETKPDFSNFTIPLTDTTVSTTIPVVTTTGTSKQKPTSGKMTTKKAETATTTKPAKAAATTTTTAKLTTKTTGSTEGSFTTKFSSTTDNQPSVATLTTNDKSTTATTTTSQNTTPKQRKQDQKQNSSISTSIQTSLLIALLCIAFFKTM